MTNKQNDKLTHAPLYRTLCYGMFARVPESTHPYAHKRGIWLSLCKVVNGETFVFSQKSDGCTSPKSFFTHRNMYTCSILKAA